MRLLRRLAKLTKRKLKASERRQHYRKRFRSMGLVMKKSGNYEFRIRDLSVDGLGAYFNGDPRLEPGIIVRIRLPSLNMEGLAMVTRLTPIGKGQYSAGFHFNPSTFVSLR
jgi:hypothetical protein